jgi:hypothetical protein
MAENLYRAIRSLLPEAPTLVGLVLEHHEDFTSTVQLPGPVDLQTYARNIFTGAKIRARGVQVPVGARAFVRVWQNGYVIETQAADGDILDIPIGEVVAPPVVITWAVSASITRSGDSTRIVEPTDADYAALVATLAPADGSWPYASLPLDLIVKGV